MKKFGFVALVALAAVMICGLTSRRVVEAFTRRSNAESETTTVADVPVDVIVVATRDLVDEVRIAGTLRALHEADVVADVPGRVEAVLVDVGADVRRGQALARLERGDLELQVEQAKAGLAGAQAGSETAARDLASATSMAQVGGLTEAQLIAAKSRASASEAQVAAATAALGLARARLEDSVLRAPFDGVVVRRGTDVGRMVSPGVAAFGVADLSELELVVAVDERVAATLKAGDPVGVASDTVAAAQADGHVKTVSPMLDPTTHRAEVVVGIARSPGLLGHAGATATFRLGRAVGVMAVPSGAVVDSNGEQVVFVVEGAVVRRTVVRSGIRDGDWIEVTGVPAGASVVVTGNTYLSDGATVAVQNQVPS